MRVCERVVRRLLLQKFKERESISELQFGGREKMGTAEALIYFTSKVREGVEIYGECSTCFLDMRKAFDRVNKRSLIQKLSRKAGIQGPLLVWVNSFLSNRTQRVKIS